MTNQDSLAVYFGIALNVMAAVIVFLVSTNFFSWR